MPFSDDKQRCNSLVSTAFSSRLFPQASSRTH
jgi:hypothetical protein